MMPIATLKSDSLVQRNPEIVHSAIDGEVVMMSLEEGMYFGLDAVGSRIWNLLETPRKVDELCRLLTDAYEVDEDRCFREVAAFLGEMEQQKIVIVTG